MSVRLATVRDEHGEHAAVVDVGRGVVLVRDLWPEHSGDVMALLDPKRQRELAEAAAEAPERVFADAAGVRYGPLYREPHLLWGIGLNYVDHAADLSETVPDEPASFIKGSHTIIGDGDEIPLPWQSQRTTAEAELGVVIGRRCVDVEPAEALAYVAGVCPILDQTAEDILQRNPRFLTRSKNFPGFFSFGPVLVPLDEAVGAAGELGDIEVATVINGSVHRRNTVANMRYDPAFLISFHSKVMPLRPGDVISTGSPGGVHLRPGDVVEAHVSGVGVLRNRAVAGRGAGASS